MKSQVLDLPVNPRIGVPSRLTSVARSRPVSSRPVLLDPFPERASDRRERQRTGVPTYDTVIRSSVTRTGTRPASSIGSDATLDVQALAIEVTRLMATTARVRAQLQQQQRVWLDWIGEALRAPDEPASTGENFPVETAQREIKVEEMTEADASLAASDLQKEPFTKTVDAGSQVVQKDPSSRAEVSEFRITELAFCTQISWFDSYTPRTHKTFRPGERTLVYCELAGVHPNKSSGSDRPHVRIRSRIQLHPVDIEGLDDEPVWDTGWMEPSEVFAEMDDHVVAHVIDLPSKLPPGAYRLQIAQVEETAEPDRPMAEDSLTLYIQDLGQVGDSAR